MANLVLFEVEVGGRTCVIGGFSTNGWVTHLSSEEGNINGSFESEQDGDKIQGRNGSFIFNLTDNMRFDEMTSSWAADYYTKAFIVDNDRTFPTENEDSQTSESEKSQPQ